MAKLMDYKFRHLTVVLLFGFIIISPCLAAYNNDSYIDCEQYKLKCHNDTDCFHRIFYAHSTCITGKCKSQCKTAVLRLYETDYGRKILHSDLSCVESVKSEIVNCHLNPEADQVHCTLARQMCDSEPMCHSAMTAYEARCEYKLLMAHRCRPECVSLLADVFSTEEGQKLSNCVCWPDDALCHHMKSHVIDPCKSDARLYMNDPKKYQPPKVTEYEDTADNNNVDLNSYQSNTVPVSGRNIGSNFVVVQSIFVILCTVILFF